MRSYNKSGKMKSKHSCVQKRIFKSAEVGIIISPKPVNRCYCQACKIDVLAVNTVRLLTSPAGESSTN